MSVHRVTEDRDFLSLVPTLLGFQPQNSLVIVLFDGDRAKGGVRITLTTDPDVERHLVMTATSLVVQGEATGVVLVAYSDDEHEQYQGLLDALSWNLDSVGVKVGRVLYVASDGYGSYNSIDLPRPVSELAPPPGVPAPLFNQDEGAFIPPTDLELTAAVIERGFPDMDYDGFSVRAEEALTWTPANLNPAQVSWLAYAFSAPPLRDTLLVQWASDLTMGKLALQEQLSWDGKSEIDPRVGAVMLGQSARPDTARLEQALQLGRYVAGTMMALPGPISVAAWMSWAMGRSTHAAAYAELALAVDPNHGLSKSIKEMANSSCIPAWAYKKS